MVDLLSFSLRAISARVLPSVLRRKTSLGSHAARGRPPIRPRALARCRPAIVRSLSLTRSCFAITARIEMTASRNMPHEFKLPARSGLEQGLELLAVAVLARCNINVLALDVPALAGRESAELVQL